jgi:DNA-binding NarL/FixJ family response regulator
VIRVLVVDDQPLVREGIRAVLERDPEIHVADEAEHGQAALHLLHRTPVDVILMDIRMPVMDGIEATRRILADPGLASVHVVALTTFDTDEFVFQALQAGASGFLLKDAEPQDIRNAVKAAASGDALLSAAVTRRVIRAATAKVSPDRTPLEYLTEREQEVLAAVGAGLSNDDIGSLLCMSPATARTHVSRMLTKLGARDRAQLVAIAWRAGIVDV